MHSLKLPRLVGRWTPAAAAILGSAVIAAPASAQKPVGGAPAPAVTVTFNTAEILVADFGAVGDPVSVTRGGTIIAEGTINGDAALGELGVNSAHLVLGGITPGCWDAGPRITPQILPGDVVTVAGQPVAIPDITAEPPVLEGDTVVVHGTAAPADFPSLSVQLLPNNALGKFQNPRIGSSGGQFIDTLAPAGYTASLTVDAGNPTQWTARFGNLGANLADAAGATAVADFDPLGGVHPATGALVMADYEAGATPGPVAGGCTEPYAPNEAKSVSRAMISTPNLGTDLTVTGVAQALGVATGVTLIDSTGRTALGTVTAPGTAWTATVPAAQLASLADGPIRVGSTFGFGKGATVKGLLNKDTTAPAAPSASVAAGQYTSTQSVALKAAEGAIHYTTDGSDPTASSATYSKAISVASSQTIKAVAVDAAGNLSDVGSFAYSIVAPAAAPQPVVVAPIKAPKLKLDALTIGSRYSLRTVRKRGISMVIFAPEGAKVVKVRLLRNGHVITRTVRKVGSDGVITVVLPSTKKGRAKLRRGTYKVQVTPGQSTKLYGTTTTRTLRIR